MFISYAQNGEDVILYRVFGGKPGGFYIDVGACWSEAASVTKAFYDEGWRGINVEPHPEAFATLEKDRPRDINLNIALAREDGALILHEGPSPGETSAADDFGKGNWEVEAWTLRRLCETYVKGEIDFLKLDIEGLEYEVLASGDFSRFRPKVVICETTAPWSNEKDSRNLQISAFMQEHKYTHKYFDGLNDYYVANEQEGLLNALWVQPNVIDRYITLRESALKERMNLREAELCAKITTADELASTLRHEHMAREAKLHARIAEMDVWGVRTQAEHAALSARYAALDTEHAELRARHTALGSEHAELRAHHTALGSEHAELRAHHTALDTEHAELRARYAALDTEHAELRAHHTALGSEHAALSARYAALGSEHAELRAHHTALGSEHAALSGRFGQAQQELARLHGVIHQMNAWGQATMARLDSLAHQLHAMHQSTSWRVTEPMRQVSTMVSRMRSFARRAPGALARRSAAVVRWRAPGLFRFLVTNAIVRRVYLAVNQPVAAAPVVAVVAQASAPAAAPAPVTALPEIAGPDLYATNTFVSLTHAMQGWNLGRRIDA